jgi:hypothetical protein
MRHVGQAGIEVSDNGQGPAAEIADTLFEPFASTKPEGVGLGLALARQVALDHGGTLTWTRKDDRTFFSLMLPEARSTTSETTAPVFTSGIRSPKSEFLSPQGSAAPHPRARLRLIAEKTARVDSPSSILWFLSSILYPPSSLQSTLRRTNVLCPDR